MVIANGFSAIIVQNIQHTKKDAVERHQVRCGTDDLTEKIMPKPGTKIGFKNYERTIMAPFTIYADCESHLVKRDVQMGKSTTA